MYDLVIANGRVFSSTADVMADVGIVGERIAAIGQGLAGKHTIDAGGMYVLPGAIDGHVHVRTDWSDDPALLYADDFATATAAAAFGGVTTIIDQVHVTPGMSLGQALDRRQEDARGRCLVDYAEHINLREPSLARVDEIAGMTARGCPSIKLFMAGEGYAVPDDIILAAMGRVADGNGLAVVHAENDAVTRELLRQGRTRQEARPGEIEGEAAHRAIALAGVAGARVLIVHVSAGAVVREVRAAKARDAAVAAEICIHHNLLLGDDMDELGLRKYAFPVRDGSDRVQLWDGLRDGTIDVLATDHGPYARDPAKPLMGTISGLEVRVPLTFTYGVRAGRIGMRRMVELCCSRPAELHGLTTKGQLLPGYDADIVIFDPERAVRLGPDVLHSALDYSPYEGVDVRGYPVTTICRGAPVVQDGRLVGEPGWGRFIERIYEEDSL